MYKKFFDDIVNYISDPISKKLIRNPIMTSCCEHLCERDSLNRERNRLIQEYEIQEYDYSCPVCNKSNFQSIVFIQGIPYFSDIELGSHFKRCIDYIRDKVLSFKREQMKILQQRLSSVTKQSERRQLRKKIQQLAIQIQGSRDPVQDTRGAIQDPRYA